MTAVSHGMLCSANVTVGVGTGRISTRIDQDLLMANDQRINSRIVALISANDKHLASRAAV